MCGFGRRRLFEALLLEGGLATICLLLVIEHELLRWRVAPTLSALGKSDGKPRKNTDGGLSTVPVVCLGRFGRI